MNELAQHIELLLLENDCVIIPGLGGFVAHYAPAMRVAEENLFLPPTRLIGFNPQLKMNDGLLVQSYMAVYGTNFSDATKTVDKIVEDLLALLHENGKADLTNVGELRYSIYDTYDFVPYDNKITTPYLYGLDSFEMKELAEIEKPYTATAVSSIPQAEEKRKRTFELRINRSYLSNAAAMIAVIALFFFLSAPIENTDVLDTNYAQLLPDDLFERIEKQSLVITPVVTRQAADKKTIAPRAEKTPEAKRKITPVAVREVKVRQQSPAAVLQPKQETQPVAAVAPVVETPYHIIVASVATEKDAAHMARQLIDKGFPAAQALVGEGKMRVSIRSCSTHAEAYRALNEIRRNDAYQNAWVLKQAAKR